MISRRGFLGGLLAAPAIIKVATLMPVKAWAEPAFDFGSGDYIVSYWMRHDYDSGRWQFVECRSELRNGAFIFPFPLPPGPVDELTITRRG